MPDSNTPVSPQLIAAAGESSANLLMSHLTNVKNRKFTREMYKRQREDALADWSMTNEYNSPRAQMQRYQEAGLNPHLIYGQSNEGATVRSSSSSGGQASAPESGGVMRYQSLVSAKAQQDLTAKALQMQDSEIKLKEAQTMATIANSELTEVQKRAALLELGIKSDLRDTTIEFKKWELEDLKTRQNATQAEIRRANELHPGNLKNQILDQLNKAKQNSKMDKEIAYIEAMIKKVNNDVELANKLSEYDRKLIDKGINPKNPGMMRMLQEILGNLFDL